MRSKNPELMKQIQDFVNQFVLDASRTPSVDEIAKGLNISKGTAHNYLKEMNERQMISYQDGELRNRITDKCSWENVSMPISGVIPCGTPEQQVEDTMWNPSASRKCLSFAGITNRKAVWIE